MEISQPEFERGMAALDPFVRAWGFSINPEDMAEIVFAVLTHARSEASFDDIEEAVQQQLADYAFRQRCFDREAYGKQSPEEAAVGVLIGFLVAGEFETVVRATRGSRVTAEELRTAVTEYGRTLVEPDASWWSLVTVTPLNTNVGGGLHVAAPLWTQEEGRSDLTLELWLIPHPPRGYDAAIEGLHVL